jgi:hypothetical protein
MQSERGAAVSTALVDGRVEDMFFCRRVFETRFWVDGKTWQGCVEVVGRIENPGGFIDVLAHVFSDSNVSQWREQA